MKKDAPLSTVFEDWQLQPSEKKAMKELPEHKLLELHRIVTDHKLMWTTSVLSNSESRPLSPIDAITLRGEMALDSVISLMKGDQKALAELEHILFPEGR